jgi:flavin reductase (DIM6/NTAB) family NADH-FMN oxidoreductase RutF
MTIDQREFRNIVGCFATGITVITTVDEDKNPVGLTANSFTSLSLDPPMVLFCIDRTVASFDAFHANRHFAVNILSSAQQEVSQRFAKSGPEKWSGVEFETWGSGCPILTDCIANLECEIESVYEGGDHVIMIGIVRQMASRDGDMDPLLYFRGKYANLASGNSD